jgi:hypothetical protein
LRFVLETIDRLLSVLGEDEDVENEERASRFGSITKSIQQQFSDVFENDSSDDSDKDKYDLDICPDTLDKHIYNKVVELRHMKRLVEEDIENHNRIKNQFTDEFEEVDKVYLKHESRVAEISDEIRILQRQRQKRMNDLKLMVILRADQIQ